MQCFAQRRSLRKFADKALPLEMISEILYAADGINRADGRKTVPTALNRQNQKVYAATADGIYLYNSKGHSLQVVLKGDYRKSCGTQKFISEAPLILLYVADLSKVGSTAEQKAATAGTHAGSASQNVYLYAASKGLSTVLCGSVDKGLVKKLLQLRDVEEVMYSQPIGFPSE